ncbi:putative microtubule-associated protein [Helianthus debilis subsp. tardiflorus]
MDNSSTVTDVIGITDLPETYRAGDYTGRGNVCPPAGETTPLTVTGSYKDGGTGKRSGASSRRRGTVRPSLDADDLINLLHGSDPVKVELNRLENEVRDKDRKLSEAQAEIKALRLSERLREKAVEEVLSVWYLGCFHVRMWWFLCLDRSMYIVASAISICDYLLLFIVVQDADLYPFEQFPFWCVFHCLEMLVYYRYRVYILDVFYGG